MAAVNRKNITDNSYDNDDNAINVFVGWPHVWVIASLVNENEEE